MRQNAYWMKQQDDRILEYLHSERWGSASTIASEASIDISEGHVKDRLERLQYAGLVAPIYRTTYEITMSGVLYLRGNLDVTHLPKPSRANLSWG